MYRRRSSAGFTTRSSVQYESASSRNPPLARENGFFSQEYPELPLETSAIEKFLRVRKETPAHRGPIFKVLQGFYSDLEKNEGIKSPVPPRGKIGRPSKHYREISTQPELAPAQPLNATVKLVQGGASPQSCTSLSTWKLVQLFLTDRRNAGLKPKTLENYGGFLKPFAAAFPVLPQEYAPIGNYLAHRPGVQRSRFTARQHVKVFIHWLEASKYLPKDLVIWSRFGQGEAEHRFLEGDALSRLFGCCQDLQEKCLVYVLIDTKARVSEAISMTREKIWPDHANIQGKRGYREVPLTQRTYDLLCRLRARGRIFRVDDRPMSRYQAYAIIHRILRDAGQTGKKLGPHLLRHSGAVLHLMEGGDLETLRQEMGHTNIETTAIYAKLATRQVRTKHQELDLLGKLIDHNGTAAPSAAGQAPAPAKTDTPAPAVAPAAAAGEELAGLGKGDTVIKYHFGKRPQKATRPPVKSAQLGLAL